MVAQLSEVADKTFDYVVIGGGTAGLTVAARVAEDPAVSVAVLEAGEPNLDDPLIMLGGQYGATWGNPKYDWYRFTTPQKYAAGRECQWSSGKGLGGSSGMNFCAWVMPHASDIDAWEKLGNKGWNWDLYHKYAKKVEHYTEVSEDQLAEYPHTATYYNVEHTDGPVKTTVPWVLPRTERLFFNTLAHLGVEDARAPYSGDNTGKMLITNVLDRAKKWTRSYSATAYYLPNKDKSNLTAVLTEAHVSRILFADEKDDGDLVATGVEFHHEGGPHVVHARKEVILSAGAVMSPVILERSGVGRKDVLNSLDIPVLLELPGVGENVQDHVWSAVSYEMKPDEGFASFDMLRDPAFAKEQARLHELDQKNMYRTGLVGIAYLPLHMLSPGSRNSVLDDVTSSVARAVEENSLPPGREEQYELQLDMLKDTDVGHVELISLPAFMTWLASPPDPSKIYYSIMVVPSHPLSRGSIHGSSKDPSAKPLIDPHMFEDSSDLELITQGIRFVRKMAETEPFKSSTVREVDPGPNLTSNEGLKDYVRKTALTVHHPIGSLSMLPREKCGCVDTHLKVYGTKGLRVCDVSVVPIHMAAHTQATAYIIGEILADLLKGKINV